MSTERRYDAIVIGAGSVGAPAALAMATAGLRVLVLDQFASQGQGSNKAAIGGIRATHSDPAKIRLCKRTLEIVSTWEETHGHNIEWKQGGYTFVAYRDEEEATLKELLKVQKSYGLNIDWHDAEAFRRIVPDVVPSGLRGGTFSPEDPSTEPSDGLAGIGSRSGGITHPVNIQVPEHQSLQLTCILSGHIYTEFALPVGDFQFLDDQMRSIVHADGRFLSVSVNQGMGAIAVTGDHNFLSCFSGAIQMQHSRKPVS